MARNLPTLRSFKIFLCWIFGRNAHGIEIKCVVIVLCKPEDSFITTGKAILAMQPVTKSPDYSVPKTQPMVFEFLVKQYVKRKHFPIGNMIADLPADGTCRM